MHKVIDYSSDVTAKGHLEVIKVFPDGREEVHFSDENIITSGMGATLLEAFNGDATDQTIADFQLVYFQLGTDGYAGLQVSSTGALSGALASGDYGASANFEINNHSLVASGVVATDRAFGVIPFAYIKKLSPTRIMYQIFVGESTCNGETINEVGLFSRDPYGYAPGAPEQSLLCAYRFFTALAKTSAFSILFRWTIEF
tara:strand:- start:6640 stop:7239 length:600 start_codon:yes stop_codon:yes gene_type:complete